MKWYQCVIMSADVLHVQNFAQWKVQILAVIPAPTGNNIHVSPMTVNLHKGPTPRKGKQHCVSDVSVFEGRRGWFQDKCRWHFSLLTQFRRKQKKPGPLLLVYFMDPGVVAEILYSYWTVHCIKYPVDAVKYTSITEPLLLKNLIELLG